MPSASTFPKFIVKSLPAFTVHVVPLVPVPSVSRSAFWTVTLICSVGETDVALTASVAASAAVDDAPNAIRRTNPIRNRLRISSPSHTPAFHGRHLRPATCRPPLIGPANGERVAPLSRQTRPSRPAY